MFQSDDQWKYFVDTGVWPKRNQFAPQEWITNFDSDEQRFARRLLEKFTYFSEDMVRQLFKSSFISLSKYVLKDKNDTNLSAREWEEFLDNLYILKVTGENPSDADSGFIFTRMSRDILGIPESRLLNSSNFIRTIQSNPKANFVFVDDFVGSGSQFVTLWTEQKIAEDLTFDSLYKSYSNHRFFYCPAICTKRGYDYIKSNCPVEGKRPLNPMPIF